MKSIIISLLLLFLVAPVFSMQRPNAIGLPAAIRDNHVVRTCSKCCSVSCCCPLAAIVGGVEIFTCACVYNPELSDHCGSNPCMRVIKVGMGAALLSVLGLNTYIKKHTKEQMQSSKERMHAEVDILLEKKD